MATLMQHGRGLRGFVDAKWVLENFEQFCMNIQVTSHHYDQYIQVQQK